VEFSFLAPKGEFHTVINGTQLRHFAVLVLTLLCTGAMALGCAANKSPTPSELGEVEIKTIDPLKAFEEEYKAIGEKVEKGSLSAEVMSRASEMRIGLHKYLIKTEAELEILRLDVLHGAEVQRETVLKQIVELVVEREQTKMSYLQKLKALKTGGRTSEDKTGIKGTAKDLDIKIKIAPEDIGDGAWP